MAIPLLNTKLYIPPARPGLVSRPQLLELLEERLRLGCKLTLVSAPAGFGKTTLVTEWLRTAERSISWLSLDEGDNDPVRFWSYVIAAIQAIHPDVGHKARQIVSSPELPIVGSPQLPNAEPAVISLLNEIAALASDLVLVLDDYHTIQEEQVHKGLSYLLDHQPPNLHLVLIARADPPLSLARLRAHGRLIEIRAADLQFSSDEATMLFNEKMDLSLEPKQVAALHLRTEGWVVGLQLAALSLRGHTAYDTFVEQFTSSHQFILDYLTEEVLRTLPDAKRQFLLRTSILGRFCGALCQAVTGDAASQRLLEEIRKGNLFLIPLEPGGGWYRYQHLFAKVLQVLLERDHADEMATLHLRAAAWFDDQGYADEAVDHVLRSGDMQRAKELILKHWISIIHRGEVTTVLRWLDALPEEMERDDPSMSLARCWALFLSGQAAAIAPHLEWANDAYERLVSEGTLDGDEQSLIFSQLAMMRSVLARNLGKHARSVSLAEKAIRLMPPAMLETEGVTWNMLGAARAGAGDYDGAIEAFRRGIELTFEVGNLAGAYGPIYGRAMYLIVQGRLDEADDNCRLAIEHGLREGHGDLPATGWPHVALARIELERYRLDEAEVHLNNGVRIGRPGGFGELLRAGRYLRAHLAAARGNKDGAVEILQDTARIVEPMHDPYLTGELAREWAAFCLNTGDLHGARIKLANLDEMCTATQHANLLIARDWLTAFLLCAEGRHSEALDELAEAIQRARASTSKGTLVRLLALQAVALDATGKREPARSVLRETMNLGAPGGYIWRWLDAGPGIGPLLRDLRDNGDTPQLFHPYLDSLLDACQAAFGETTRSQPGDLLDPLTPRELEIMRLICKGYSNPEIASELVVTINTIKKHTSNIYGKLGVRSRTQAIARAQQLNLL